MHVNHMALNSLLNGGEMSQSPCFWLSSKKILLLSALSLQLSNTYSSYNHIVYALMLLVQDLLRIDK